MLVLSGVSVTPPNAAAPAARDISLEVGPGEWVAVTGPNGCGKSSLLLAAAGLWPASAGTVEADGAPLAATPEARARARFAAVLQEPSSQLFERTVRDELAFTLRNLGVPEAEADRATREWAERLGLGSLLDRDPHQLSAGQQQRVLLAAALASGPRLLLADEPAAHLDPRSRAEVLDVVRAERSRGLGVLWVTQEADEIAAADRVVRIDRAGSEAASSDVDSGPIPFPPTAPWAGAAGRISIRIEARTSETGPVISVSTPVEFEVGPGSPVALTGPNGCGKSVTLEALAGAIASPQITIRHLDPPDSPDSTSPPDPQNRKAAAVAPVLLAQYPELQVFGDTVRDEIAFALSRRGAPLDQGLQAATRMLEFLGLEVGLSRSPWALSSGERRMVQAVAALVTPGSMLLMDEPTVGLDPVRAARLGRLVAVAATRGPVVIATQDPAMLRASGAKRVEMGSVSPLTAGVSGKMD